MLSYFSVPSWVQLRVDDLFDGRLEQFGIREVIRTREQYPDGPVTDEHTRFLQIDDDGIRAAFGDDRAASVRLYDWQPGVMVCLRDVHPPRPWIGQCVDYFATRWCGGILSVIEREFGFRTIDLDCNYGTSIEWYHALVGEHRPSADDMDALMDSEDPQATADDMIGGGPLDPGDDVRNPYPDPED
jgi:hypothetical protein